MDLENYQNLIKNILIEGAKYPPSHGNIESFTVFDEGSDSYQLMQVGWSNDWRTHGAVIHIRLHNGKIWIEHDGTEEGVAQTLLDAGVPKEDIVLAFHPEWKRKWTDFAVA